MRDDRPHTRQWRVRPVRARRNPRSNAALTVLLVAVSAAVLVALPAGAEKAAADVSSPIYLDTGYSFGERAADLDRRGRPPRLLARVVAGQHGVGGAVAEVYTRERILTFLGWRTQTAIMHKRGTPPDPSVLKNAFTASSR